MESTEYPTADDAHYYYNERVDSGDEPCRIQVWSKIGGEGEVFVTWLPDDSSRGRTYTRADSLLPKDFPMSNDPDELYQWARRRWG